MAQALQNLQTTIGVIVLTLTFITIALVLFALITAKSEPRTEVKSYTLDKQWTYGPLLFAAIDEPIRSGHHDAHEEEDHSILGGSAHGTW